MTELDGSPPQPSFIGSVEQLVEGAFYCLPSESIAIDEQLAIIAEHKFGLAGDIENAMEQSSETWHDNAPADVLFGHLKQLDKKEARIVSAARNRHEVPFPTREIDFITIGTRALCDIDGDQFFLDIVGNMPVDGGSNGEVETGSVDAPLPRALLGKRAGEITDAEIAPGRQLRVRVVSIDQEVQKTEFELHKQLT